MHVIVNAAPVEFPDGATVATLVTHHTGRALEPDGAPADGRPLPLAVAIGDEIVPRSAWSQRDLRDGDSVDLVTAVQGG